MSAEVTSEMTKTRSLPLPGFERDRADRTEGTTQTMQANRNTATVVALFDELDTLLAPLSKHCDAHFLIERTTGQYVVTAFADGHSSHPAAKNYSAGREFHTITGSDATLPLALDRAIVRVRLVHHRESAA